MVTFEEGAMWCHFIWSSLPQVLACTDPRMAATLARLDHDSTTVRPGTRIVVALQPPVDGQCHKVVEALVPRR